MRRSAIATALLAVLIGAVGVARAQSQAGATSETGTLITRRAAEMNGTGKADARMTTWRFGQCAVARLPQTAATIASVPYGTRAYEKLIDQLVVDDCLSTGELTLPNEAARYTIFEGLYLRAFGTSPVDITDVAPIDYAAAYSSPISPRVANVIALGRFGDCVARADQANARAMVLSIPDSSGEQKAISALSVRLGPCVPTGSKVTFSRGILRGSVAEGLYRLSVAAAAVAR